jgi:hypothetical protein
MKINTRTERKHEISMELNDWELKVLLFALERFNCYTGEFEDAKIDAEQIARNIREGIDIPDNL